MASFKACFMAAAMAAAVSAADTIRVEVKTEDPMPFYSSQGDECPKGMVGIINPNDEKTLDGYKKQAKALSKAVQLGSKPYGGETAENTDPAA